MAALRYGYLWASLGLPCRMVPHGQLYQWFARCMNFLFKGAGAKVAWMSGLPLDLGRGLPVVPLRLVPPSADSLSRLQYPVLDQGASSFQQEIIRPTSISLRSLLHFMNFGPGFPAQVNQLTR